LEKSDGTVGLVMELVEGPTLADRIAKGAIPIDEALPIAKQIAEALEPRTSKASFTAVTGPSRSALTRRFAICSKKQCPSSL